jgi:hypothetical protein
MLIYTEPLSPATESEYLEIAARDAKSISTTASGFPTQLILNDILDPTRLEEPSNLKEVKKTIMQPRPESPSLDEDHFEQWRASHINARNEEDVKFSIAELLVD